MKRKELNKIRALGTKELEKSISDKKIDLVEVKANMAVSKAKNLKKVKMLRREISQITTILNEKRLTEEIVQKGIKDKGKEEKR